MKPLKPWWWAGGGLLHLTVLLSLAGLRLDLGLHLPPPPPALLPSPASGAWGRAGQLRPKGPEPDPAVPIEGRLLREVRALGVPFVPHTRVDAWLVHSVAAGDAAGAQRMLGASGGAGAGVDGGSQAAAGGGGDPRVGRSSLLATEEETAPAEPTAQVPHAASQENEVLGEVCEGADHSFEQEVEENALQQNEDGIKLAEKTESRNERHLNGTDTSFSLEDLFQLISSQPEYSLEGISLEDIPPFPSSINNMNSSAHYNVNFSQAISQDVNLHEAMLLCPNNSTRRYSVARTSQAQEPFPQLNFHTDPEQTPPGANMTVFLPPVDNQMRNLTSQDLLYDLDANIFDEINLMSLATEGFDPMEVVQLFEEPDTDSGLSLNSSPNSTFTTQSNSSHSLCDEGAIGYSSNPESLSHNLEGAVGGYYAEPSKLFHMDQRDGPGFHRELMLQHVLHNHTYHLQPEPEPTSQSFSWSGKSQKMSRNFGDRDGNLSRDERRAKALHIPFSVDEIVHMPVDSFNSMLTSYYLTDLQVSLIRDIRRRGKNKVAAQNCRRRKLDIIFNLENDICDLQAKKETLKREGAHCNKAISIMKQKLHDLYHDVFSRLRDDQGRPVNPNQYALQCSHDGTVLIVPKELVVTGHKKETQKEKRKGERKT